MYYVICRNCESVAFIYRKSSPMPRYLHERSTIGGEVVHGIQFAMYPDGLPVAIRRFPSAGKPKGREKARCHCCNTWIDESQYAQMTYLRKHQVGLKTSEDLRYISMKRKVKTLLEAAGRMRFLLVEIVRHGAVGLSESTVSRARWVLSVVHQMEDEHNGVTKDDQDIGLRVYGGQHGKRERVGGGDREVAGATEQEADDPHDESDGGADAGDQGPADSHVEGDAGLRGRLAGDSPGAGREGDQRAEVQLPLQDQGAPDREDESLPNYGWGFGDSR